MRDVIRLHKWQNKKSYIFKLMFFWYKHVINIFIYVIGSLYQYALAS